MTSKACSTNKEDRIPAAEGIEVASQIDVCADALSVDTLSVDQLVILEDHFSLIFKIIIPSLR